jgi:hypothetical protein
MLLITVIHIKTQLGWSFRRQMYFVQGFFVVVGIGLEMERDSQWKKLQESFVFILVKYI